MTVTLAKGGSVSLSKQAPGLTSVGIGLGWDARVTSGADFDLDASAFVLAESDTVLSDGYFVFFNNLTSPDGAVEHKGDNLVGGGGGDDEQIDVHLGTLPPTATKIVIAVSIYEAEARDQSFGQVRNAYMRVVDRSGDAELARFDLSEDASGETAMVFGELARERGEWQFRAVGQGYHGGLHAIARGLGVKVG